MVRLKCVYMAIDSIVRLDILHIQIALWCHDKHKPGLQTFTHSNFVLGVWAVEIPNTLKRRQEYCSEVSMNVLNTCEWELGTYQ